MRSATPDLTVLLTELVRTLADRRPDRTEATAQSSLHALLLAAPFQLEERHLTDIVLEQPSGQRRRIDVEAGHCVFEIKRDLRKGNVRKDGETQLAGYVAHRSEVTGQRYVGVLTDGCEWHLYRLHDSSLECVSSLEVSHESPDLYGLIVWLEGVLAIGEQLTPTPVEIERLLGAGSPGHLLDFAELKELYAVHRELPSVRLKRHLWAKLLTTALGTAFHDDETLFVQHTLLVASAEVIAHAVLDIDPRQISPQALVTGQQFRAAKVFGVVEVDFFDWVAEVPGGDRFVRELARRLARFAWAAVEHDILKVLYESIIPTAQCKKLGEYYTPDWLAEHVVNETVADPLTSRVLDPSCGSGTFVFYAVRRLLAAADTVGMKNADALALACSSVMGMDLHPVAVTLARVTYLLAIGSDRLKAGRGPLTIPVFLGDSLQWGQERDPLQSHGALVVATDEGAQLFATQLRFPDALLIDANRFDTLVAELADLSASRKRGSPVPTLVQVHKRHAIAAQDQATIEQTFKTMCELHDQGRDHIWGYYVRNLARPRWLAREGNRVDVLVGNPPWLSYRFMTAAMQKEFRRLLKERDLWTDAKSVPHLDLSGLFVVRMVERYLTMGGRFAFVMPYAVLSRQHFEGFRKGVWPRPDGFAVAAAFDTPWDVHGIKPSFFEVPAAVVRGTHTEEANARRVPATAQIWSGRVESTNSTWAKASVGLRSHDGVVTAAPTSQAPRSPYAERFTQGATLVPRVLCFVEELAAGRLGRASGEIDVRSRRTASEKLPWRTLPSMQGTVEAPFVHPVHLGDTVLPFRALEPLRGVIPWDGRQLLHGGDEFLGRHPGLQNWWTRAEDTWMEHRSSDRLTLIQRFDFQRGLSVQFSADGLCAPIRVVYSASGMYLAAAAITDPTAVVEHKLYWAACTTLKEARYLCALLNSDAVTQAVRKYQARGEHNPRDFDKYVWQLPIASFDAKNATHVELAELGKKAEAFAATIQLPKTRFEKQRRHVRESINASAIGKRLALLAQNVIDGG